MPYKNRDTYKNWFYCREAFRDINNNRMFSCIFLYCYLVINFYYESTYCVFTTAK